MPGDEELGVGVGVGLRETVRVAVGVGLVDEFVADGDADDEGVADEEFVGVGVAL